MEVTLASGTALEREIAGELTALLDQFDLSPWQYTDQVVIEENAIPRSHPALTLGTFNRGPFLLASYLHEQLHWYALDRMAQFEDVYESHLRQRFPDVPTQRPEGAGSAESTYLHLLVCWLEVDAVRRVLGRERAAQIVDVMVERGVYRWVYRVVRDHFEDLRDIFSSGGLTPRTPPE